MKHSHDSPDDTSHHVYPRGFCWNTYYSWHSVRLRLPLLTLLARHIASGHFDLMRLEGKVSEGVQITCSVCKLRVHVCWGRPRQSIFLVMSD
jgi:hypothetical protein